MELVDIIRTSAEFGAAKALEDAGLVAGEISQKQATKIYHSFFTRAVAEGRLRPVRTGSAVNSTKYYRIADILALRLTEETEAYLVDTNTKKQTI